MELEFGDVAVVVQDPAAAARWWQEKLGLEIRSNEGHWVTVAPKGATTEIHLCKSSDRNPVDPGNTGIGFTTRDALAAEKELLAKGVKVSHPAKQGPAGTVLRFLDPDGNEYWISDG